MMPVRRDLRFNLPSNRVSDWHAQGPYVSHLLNTFSLFFPSGERFFIHSVRHYRDRIGDERLKKAVTAFIGQEAMHTREHEEMNRLLAAAGLPAERLERRASRLLEWVKARMPASVQLSATIALEHFTAMMAGQVLADARNFQGSEPHFLRLWTWHALEETEHKAVAYDVWARVIGRGPLAYLNRSAGLIAATVIFWALVAEFHWEMVRADRSLPTGLRARLRGYGGLLRYMFVRPGFLRRIIPEWFDYFRPGFHPWDHDNASQLQRIDALLAELEQSRQAEAA